MLPKAYLTSTKGLVLLSSHEHGISIFRDGSQSSNFHTMNTETCCSRLPSLPNWTQSATQAQQLTSLVVVPQKFYAYTNVSTGRP